MTTFVSTLGFDTSHLYSRIVNEDVSDGDHLILVRPDDDDSRGEDAVQQIEGMLEKLEEEFTKEVIECDPNDFEGTTNRLVERLNRIEDDVIVNLAGGDRALIIPLSLAVMSASVGVSSTHVRSDVTRESQNVDLPPLRPPLDEGDREVLNYVLENGPVSNTRIAAATDVSDSTISRRVEKLEEMGYVEVEDGKGSNSVSPTFSAALVENRL
jgi:CRISPR locus-related DNA-binding protein